ncbi:MAG TPA: secondary thiamine-phosphate synthase enzyme YjbQ [Verrucomicrobiae bacterium]|nr:secondary thiamine-phosphate synthase enzyme YjbQ [Verrucomicrobiae bacterium]
MTVSQTTIYLSTKGRCDVIDITARVARAIHESGIETGIVNVSGVGSTLGITTLEFEPGCVSDFERALEKIAPSATDYAHNARWGDENGFSHLRSALVGTAKTFPIRQGRPGLGTWQQIVLCDFDDRPREREIIVTVMGEPKTPA